MTTKGNGQSIKWIQAHLNYPHEDYCLIWPFYRLRGYGQFGYLGKNYYAHRYMCELVHGEPPTPDHQAAHSCGNGVEGCANPRHLSWKTKSENQLDCRAHGTHAKAAAGNRGILSRDLAEQIRAMKGIKTQWEIAEEYGISESTVSDIWLNRTWTRQSKIVHWTSDEDDKIREGMRTGQTFAEMATEIGRPKKAVTARAYRIGLHSGVPAPGHSS